MRPSCRVATLPGPPAFARADGTERSGSNRVRTVRLIKQIIGFANERGRRPRADAAETFPPPGPSRAGAPRLTIPPRRGPAASPRHRRVGPALVDEDRPPRVRAGQLLAEFPPLLLDLRAVRLPGARDLLLARQPELAQGARGPWRCTRRRAAGAIPRAWHRPAAGSVPGGAPGPPGPGRPGCLRHGAWAGASRWCGGAATAG
jgi:hypothetical protein